MNFTFGGRLCYPRVLSIRDTAFLNSYAKGFGSGRFNLAGNIAMNTLAFYYSSLREDALSNPDRDKQVFFHSDHFGFQSGTYWILLPDVSIYEVNFMI